MYSVRIDAVIPENRQLAITVPPEIPEGDAEIIILSKHDVQRGNGQMLLRYLRERQLLQKSGRSSDEIDAYIEQERNAWN